MRIAGLQKMTLLDYPGRVACTIFLQGCNFRCPFCHNRDLLVPDAASQLTQQELLSFLNKRIGLLDGVCVTGGEPTIHKDLPEFLSAIKELGYAVKLDTNGARPEMLKAVTGAGLADFVAMDIKNSPDAYAETAGIGKNLICHYSSEVPYRQYVMPAIFRTVYCCGLRPGEARRLKCGDVDLDRGVITIHASKYDADREVPLSVSLWELLREYTDTVHKMTESEDAPFFPGYLGKEITTDNMNTNFRRFLRYAGISHGGPGKGPRIYDFRHTFAVNTLKTLILRGENMNAYYPLLKTYMGHSFFKYTEYYLRLTKSMFPDICQRLTGFLEEDLPIWEMEADNEEAN